MVAPGLQVTEIVTVIDQSIKLVVKLREAPNEIRSILRSVEHATRFLKVWKQHLEDYEDEFLPTQLEYFKSTTDQYANALDQLETFTKKHGRLPQGGVSARLYWVVTQHFRDDRASLEKELGIAELRLGNAINFHNSIQYSKLGRSNSLAQAQTQDEQAIYETQRKSSLSQANPLEPTAGNKIQHRVSPQLSARTSTVNTLVAEPGLYSSTVPASPNSFSTTSNSSPNPWNTQDRYSSRSIPSEGDHRSLRSETCTDPATRSPSIFSAQSARTSITQYSPELSPTHSKYALGTQIESWNRFSIAEGDEDGSRTQNGLSENTYPPSPSFGTSLKSSTESAHISENLPKTRSQSWNEVSFQPSNNRRQSSTYPVQGLSHNTPESTHTLATSSRSHTLSASNPAPAMTLPSSMMYRMDVHGEIRIWCYSGQDRSRNRQDYVVRDIDIVRQSGQAASEICIMTTAGMFVVHRGPSNISISQSLLRSRLPSDVARSHPLIKSQLLFMGKQSLLARKKDGGYKLFLNGAIEYVFTDERDNISFQSHIVGRTLLSEDRVESISFPSNKSLLSRNLYLQLWKSGSRCTIRFFRNVDGKNMFWEHDVTEMQRYLSEIEKKHLRDEKTSKKDKKKDEKEWRREVNLRLLPQTGDKHLQILRLLFISETEKNEWLEKVQMHKIGGFWMR